MQSHRKFGIHRREMSRRSPRLARSLGAIAICAALGMAAAACGSSSPRQAATANLAAGIAAQEVGKYPAATADYNKVLAAQPTNADALFDLGDVEQFQNLNTAAVSHYQAALAVDPNFVAAMYNLATLVSSSSPVEAESLYRHVIRLAPKYADAHFNLGFVLISLGRKVAGRAQINRGVALDPSLRSRIPPSLEATTATTTTTTPANVTTTTKG